ncbi:SNARE associated golgi family protein [Oceaniovalibus guishaninsula JLT2003]|uniref:SNARE associated golgi family protein n=1 Tax=Oceaniovalibus guishaninsula JLT2003 TaxID=1231392 RepID=K2I6V2_9RHOB|nr:DedA family protein [Oceaniovalibus guishaninsula]EKE44715.1 SNARE associated golgi family protein [Oceaniovalibus guishaninsula JLT2003]
MFDFISGIIAQVGYLGIAFLMFAENVFPPIPSELIMPLAGFNAASGELGLIGVLLAGIAGSLAGAVFWYWIGLKIGAERIRRLAARHGRWLTVSPQEFDQAQDWFNRYGALAVLIGRLIPTVRTFISVPAGLQPMPLGKFVFYSTLGTAAWTAFLTLAGYFLESQYSRVSDWLNPVSTVVVVAIVGIYLWRVATYRRRVGAEGDRQA